MPTPALSLVGFLDQAAAIAHLRHKCVPEDNTDTALLAEWASARSKLGPAFVSAGKPTVLPIPASHSAYMAALLEEPWLTQALSAYGNVQFGLVEIDPLLVYQTAIDTYRSTEYSLELSCPPTLDEAFGLCIPDTIANEQIDVVPGPHNQSMLLKSKSLNLRSVVQGMLPGNVVGVVFGLALPLVHVVRLAGRCYLHNGLHRAYALRMAGATHAPCLIRNAANPSDAGIREDGTGFGYELLSSRNPPTMGHFTGGRAYNVQLRSIMRIIQISWGEYIVPDE